MVRWLSRHAPGSVLAVDADSNVNLNVLLFTGIPKKSCVIGLPITTVQSDVGKLSQLRFEYFGVPGLPQVLKDNICRDCLDTHVPEMNDTLTGVGQIVAAESHLGCGPGILSNPELDVFGYDIIRALAVLEDAMHVMFPFGSIYADRCVRMVAILPKKSLDLIGAVCRAIGGDQKPVQRSPWMVLKAAHRLPIISSDIGYQVHLQCRFATHKLHDNDRPPTGLTQEEVNSTIGDFSGHDMVRILVGLITIAASHVTVFCHDQSHILNIAVSVLVQA